MADEVAEEMVTINSYPSERVAREHAKTLVENGVGAIIEPGRPADVDGRPTDEYRDTDEYAASFELRVMRQQVPTACEVLGLDPPEGVVTPVVEAPRKGTPLKRILIIWAIAMVVVPLAAGYLTFVILSR